ncbi:MAG: transcriptional regulator PpsR [Rhodobacteraceae bacterium]|nr:transcriptional regulator PpsR [Paracoccaceae bacterium]
MSTPISQSITPFQAPDVSLEGIGPTIAARAIAAAADVALVLDGAGVVRDVAFGGEAIAREGFSAWVGRAWGDAVTPESRPKIDALLSDALAQAAPRWRQVNHPSTRGEDVPVVYAALPLTPEADAPPEEARILAVGRDMRAIASLQQRLVEAQRAMEKDYSRFRQAETRYRLLFQLASEAVLIVDESGGRVLEANPAAIEALGETVKKPVGRALADLFEPGDREAVRQALAAAKSAGRSTPVMARLREPAKSARGEKSGDRAGEASRRASISASLFRSDEGVLYLVRLEVESAEGRSRASQRASLFAEVVESAPEALVVADLEGRVLTCNAAFLELAELASEEQARGQSLDRWLGRPGVDVSVILSALREHGSLRLFASMMRGDLGGVAEVELSAVSVPHGEPPCLGFMIRNVESRLSAPESETPALPKSVEQLTELVGRVPLKDIVRETTDVIERLCIEAALELTDDNRASAAEVLGLSRQSLYVKLRRYGLGDLDVDGEA